jgi:hypothetical protein
MALQLENNYLRYAHQKNYHLWVWSGSLDVRGEFGTGRLPERRNHADFWTECMNLYCGRADNDKKVVTVTIPARFEFREVPEYIIAALKHRFAGYELVIY